MSLQSTGPKQQRQVNKKRRRTTDDNSGTQSEEETPTPSTSNTNIHLNPPPPMNDPNNQPGPSAPTPQPPTAISDKNQALFKIINKITRGLEKAKHHKTFLTGHTESGTTPRGLVPNISCQIPEISPEFHLEWENTLTETGKALCKILIRYWELRTTTLQAQFDTYYLQLQAQCNPEELTTVNRILDNLRSTIQQELRDRRNRKNRRFRKIPTTETKPTVVNLSSYHLTPPELSLLQKGLTFSPTFTSYHPVHRLQDTYLFTRRIRLKHWFQNNDNTLNDNDILHSLKESSGWTPPLGKDEELDCYINTIERHINQLPNKPAPRNTNQLEFEALTTLRNNPDIIIKPADKGGAIVILNKADYIKEANPQLSNSDHYLPTPTDPTPRFQKEINKYIDFCVQTDALPLEALTYLKKQHPRTPCLYFLPKIHKTNHPGRPIVSGCGSPTEPISHYVDKILNPFVPLLPSYIKDTAHFLQILDSIQDVQPGDYLMTIDVSALYTNIPHVEGIQAAQRFLLQRPTPQPPTHIILRLVHLILTKNAFMFNNKFYHQIKGTAMGTKMAPTYANLFMGHLEHKLLQNSPIRPKVWKRFIDDIFCIIPNGERDAPRFIEYLNQQHTSIKFTAEFSPSTVNYLDVTVYVNDDHKLQTTLYTKPTDAHLYLHYSSHHPPHQKNSIPYSQLLRVRLICSTIKEFDSHGLTMLSHFASRGYPKKLLWQHYDQVRATPRNTLLHPPQHGDNQPIIPLIINYQSQHHKSITEILRTNQSILDHSMNNDNFLRNKILIAYRKNPNLRNLLTNSPFPKPVKHRGTHQCWKNCSTCPLIRSQTHIKDSTGRNSYPTVGSSTCLSTCVVYAIICKKCEKIYIGQTKNTLHQRRLQHSNDIVNQRVEKPVARHFNDVDHSLADVTIMVVDDTARSLNNRLRLEEAWIRKLSTYQPKGLNIRT